MAFSMKEGVVRVDFFKPSGKWYGTSELNMSGVYHDALLHGAIASCLDAHGLKGYSTQWRDWLKEGGFILILEPYHINGHPVLLTPSFIFRG